VVLVEGGERVLSTYAPVLSEKAREQLEKLGVEVRLRSMVTSIEADAVQVGDERIATRNVVWAAGVAASPLGEKLGCPLDRMGRVEVEPDLSVPGVPNVFVVGDLAAFTHDGGAALPGTAPVAMQQARLAAANVVRLARGEPTLRFQYRDRGSMATIGRAAAVAQLAGLKLHGFLAWMAWLFIHILFLIGFRNRVAVMMEWAWSYLTWQRGARLITGEIGASIAGPGRVLGTPDAPTPSPASEPGSSPPADPAAEDGWGGKDADRAASPNTRTDLPG
jgi:NADH:ubiquinone reductase (H+-translocating)